MEQKKSNGLAIASFIIGLLSFLLSCCYGGFLGILSLIFGILALSKKQSKGFSISGIILSSLAVIISLISLLFGFALLDEINNNKSTNSNTSVEKENTSDKEIATIDKTVVCDENGIKITAISLETDCIKVKIENNSDKTITAESITAINGCMMYSPKMYCSGIAPGNTANSEIPLDNLDKYGIEVIGNIKLAFKIHEESENYSLLWFRTDIAELNTNCIDTCTNYSPNGNEVFNDTFSVTYIDIEDSTMEKSILLYVENPTENDFVFSCENLAINKISLDTYGEEEIFAGCGSIIEVDVSNSSLDENNITEIESVDLGAYTYNASDYQKITDTQQIKFSTK